MAINKDRAGKYLDELEALVIDCDHAELSKSYVGLICMVMHFASGLDEREREKNANRMGALMAIMGEQGVAIARKISLMNGEVFENE
jgi:hypothetical protein